VHRITVRLGDDDRARLAELARGTGRSRSAVVRAALSAYRPPPSLDGCVAVEGVSGRAIAQEDDPLRGFGE
jgi:hypothetical protein